MKKKISIIIATKDRSRFLKGCLDSILQQTLLKETEVLIIDKSSTNQDRAVVKEYKEKFSTIKYIRQQSLGLYAAWNIGIQNACGQYLINLNSDDRLKSNALEILSAALDKNPRIALVYGDSYITNKPYESFEKNSSRGRLLNIPDYSHKKLLLNCICGPHPMWRKKLHKEFGLFDTRYKVAGDYEFWLRVSEKYQLLHINKSIGLYYKNPKGLGSSPQTIKIKAAENLKIKQQYLNSSIKKH